MRRTLLLVLTGFLGMPLACSDRLPTSPLVGTSTASQDTGGASEASAPARNRHVVVVAPRSAPTVTPGVWGSDSASLIITGGSATLEILSSMLPERGCFAAYGEIGQPIPNGTFSIAGTYTQLIGAFPGTIQYGARYSGFVAADTISITVEVPALQQAYGPYLLASGVNNGWSPCLYPGHL